MRDLLGKNLIYKIVAIFLAVVLWMNASDQEPTFRETVVQVPLEVRNLSESFVARDIPETVKVQVEGEWSVVDKVDPDQFSAFIRLEAFEAGNHQVPVEVTVPPGVRLVNIIPSAVALQLTEITTKRLPVVVDVVGGPAAGYTMLEPVVEPEEVIVSGPSDILDTLRTASVRVEIRNATEDVVRVLPVTLGNDTELEVTVTPSTAKVSISVVPREQSKTVPVEVSVEGTPAEGFVVGTVQVQPETVQISGAPEVIGNISTISTLPVDVNGLEANFTGNVGLSIPEGVQLVGQSPAEANVTVEILPQQ